ncbi:MAG TPA: glycosyltransferase [Anaerolineales bacterium]|nr:glycosyltransferase [Anaerolineales bacterium]
MRLLYFSDSHGPHDHRFLQLAVDHGHEVFFLRRRPGFAVETRPLPRGVMRLPPLEPAPKRWRRFAAPLASRLRDRIEERRIEVVHAGPVQACAWLAAQAGFPGLVTMSWGSDLLVRAEFGMGRWLAAMALRRSAAFIGDCRAVLARAEALGMDPSRSVRVPWGVDLAAFHPTVPTEVRRQIGWEDMVVALCLRSWEPGYGVETVLQAFLVAATEAPNLRLILAGDGSLRPQILAKLEASKYRDRIWLPGYIPYRDLPAFYRAADMYLSASISDGSSVSLLEAMASGLPAFVTDIPGNREWIEPGRMGRWFAVGDSAALALSLVEAAHSPGDLPAMGSEARKVAESRADWADNSRAVDVAYQLALERARPERGS